jgi:hypothetical protein
MRKLQIHQLYYFLFLIFLCNLSPAGAQPDLEKRISIFVKNKPAIEVLEEISSAGEINFSYSPSKIPLSRKISLSVQERTIREVLDIIAVELDITYSVVEEQVILKPAGDKEIPIAEETPQYYTMSGYVYDKETGEVLIGANIFIQELSTGTITNPYGFYSITLPAGEYTAGFSYMGYKKNLIPVSLNANKPQNVRLEYVTSPLQEVTIVANEDETEYVGLQMNQLNLEPKTVSIMPALLGEVDVIKSLQSFPGISLMADGSTLFHVRGGNKDQNLILLDDAPIYTPSHMLGFFSIFVPETVKDIKIFKGDMPAEYGGRLSSLIDIRTRDGNMKRFGISGSFGLISAKGAVEGPVLKDRSSFLISGRRSYFGWLIKDFIFG